MTVSIGGLVERFYSHNEIVEPVCEGQRAAARLRYTGTHTVQMAGPQ